MLTPKPLTRQNPAQQLVDPSLGNDTPNLSGMGLNAQEQAALNRSVQPSGVIDEFRQNDNREQSAVELYELQRMQTETDQLRSQLGQSQQALAEVQTQSANVAGQLTAMQQAQQMAQQQAQLDSQFALAPDELENHGELLPVIQKVVGKTAATLKREHEAQLAQELARVQTETAAPLRQEIDQLKQEQQTAQAVQKQQFAAQLTAEIANLGLGDSATLAANPEFTQQFNQPVYPGATVAWGDELTRHINEGNLASASQMLRSFRDSSEQFQQRDDLSVPTGGGRAAQPMTSEQTQNLNKRDQLLKIYQQRMLDANSGKFPAGMDRAKYRVAQQELQREIDAIPTN